MIRGSRVRKPLVLGVTGSIGMGKTTASRMLRRLGVPVFDADACVHQLLGPGGRAVASVAAAFPEARVGNAISRPALARAVFDDAAALGRLESILHPLVRAAEQRFVRHGMRRRANVVALEIPLLFESGADRLCDAVMVLAAPPFVQAARVLARPGMTSGRLAAIRRRQMPEAEKRRRADFVVQTGLGRRHTWRAIVAILRQLQHGPARGRTGGKLR